jgi:hypothetical protein
MLQDVLRDGQVTTKEAAIIQALSKRYEQKASASDAEELYRTLPGGEEARQAASLIKTAVRDYGSNAFTRALFKGDMPEQVSQSVNSAADTVIEFLQRAGVPQNEIADYVNETLGRNAFTGELLERMNLNP